MERVGGNGEPLVVIDYAHTPDALENALQALRDVATPRGGRLCVVFGCGGDRDKGKRPQMGQIAERLADRVLVTSDNPRSEAPQSHHRRDSGRHDPGRSRTDRAQAIRRAVLEAGDSDMILLAGKGHETYQDMAPAFVLPFPTSSRRRAALATAHRNFKEVAA
ncbi:MAG: hypothetical protein IPP59_03495 [Betaproteobacteria bacterium]|nr:hypothetical protein [Candidatus Dechloromonas phosphorivorans]